MFFKGDAHQPNPTQIRCVCVAKTYLWQIENCWRSWHAPHENRTHLEWSENQNEYVLVRRNYLSIALSLSLSLSIYIYGMLEKLMKNPNQQVPTTVAPLSKPHGNQLHRMHNTCGPNPSLDTLSCYAKCGSHMLGCGFANQLLLLRLHTCCFVRDSFLFLYGFRVSLFWWWC